MKPSTWVRIFGCLMALAFLFTSHVVRAQVFNYLRCAWPLQISPEGPGNVQALAVLPGIGSCPLIRSTKQ